MDITSYMLGKKASGGGSAEGLTSVSHDSTMLGAGTKSSPLGVDTSKFATATQGGKADTALQSDSLKTINNQSIVGSGNIDIQGGSSTDVKINGTSITSSGEANIITEGVYDASTNKIATMSDIPDDKYLSNAQIVTEEGQVIPTNKNQLFGDLSTTNADVGVTQEELTVSNTNTTYSFDASNKITIDTPANQDYGYVEFENKSVTYTAFENAGNLYIIFAKTATGHIITNAGGNTYLLPTSGSPTAINSLKPGFTPSSNTPLTLTIANDGQSMTFGSKTYTTSEVTTALGNLDTFVGFVNGVSKDKVNVATATFATYPSDAIVTPGDTLVVSGTNTTYTDTNGTLSLANVSGASDSNVICPYLFFGNSKITYTSVYDETAGGSNYYIIGRTTNGFMLVNNANNLYYVNNTGLGSTQQAFVNLKTTYSTTLPVTFEIVDTNTLKIGSTTITKSELQTKLGANDTLLELTLGISRDYRRPNDTITYSLPAASSVTKISTFWQTDTTKMTEMYERELKSITLYGNVAGTVTLRGYDTEIDKTDTLANLISAAEDADTNGYDIATINVSLGNNTYTFDGEDANVTIIDQNAIESCPATLGIGKQGDTGRVGYNKGNAVDNNYSYFVNSMLRKVSYTNSLAMTVTYVGEEASTVTNIKLTMSDGNVFRLDVSDIEGRGIVSIEKTGSSGNIDTYTILYTDGTTSTFDIDKGSSGGTAVKPLQGKKLSIIGDSISTYSGYNPSGYAVHYPRGTVNSVDKTWWYPLCTETGMELLVNASWSGSYVTGDSTSTSNALAACSNKRISDIAKNGSTPDIIICWIGINDFGQNVHRQLGDYTGVTPIPADSSTLNTFSEAYGLMLYKAMSTYPNAKVYACSLLETNSANWDTTGAGVFPTINNNQVAIGTFNERIRTIATNLGAGFIDLHSCGINYWNLSSYTNDGLHPNALGAALVKERVKSALLNDAEQ